MHEIKAKKILRLHETSIYHILGILSKEKNIFNIMQKINKYIISFFF